MEQDYGVRRSIVHCTNCGEDFRIELEMNINGNHEIECPYCGHIHYRVVQDGEVTEDRYRSSLGTVTVTVTVSTSSGTTSSGNTYLSQSWADSSNVSVYY